MVSYSNPIPMYQKSHEFNMSYPTAANWYNYSRPHHQNNQYLAGTAGSGIGGGLESDPSAASAMYYNPHHPMFTQPSPDFSDSYAFAAAAHNSPLLQSPMGQTTNGLHLNHHHHNSPIENLSNGMQNIPPSPPITVNSGCSEMSSPGITNGGGRSSGGMGNGSSSPHNGSGNLSRPKSPYEWMKKPSYQSQSQPGTSS